MHFTLVLPGEGGWVSSVYTLSPLRLVLCASTMDVSSTTASSVRRSRGKAWFLSLTGHHVPKTALQCQNKFSSPDEQVELEKGVIDLQREIAIKQQLIDELERSQRQQEQMRLHYEQKLLQLQQRISETEAERDRVLANISGFFCGFGRRHVDCGEVENEKKCAVYRYAHSSLRIRA